MENPDTLNKGPLQFENRNSIIDSELDRDKAEQEAMRLRHKEELLMDLALKVKNKLVPVNKDDATVSPEEVSIHLFTEDRAPISIINIPRNILNLSEPRYDKYKWNLLSLIDIRYDVQGYKEIQKFLAGLGINKIEYLLAVDENFDNRTYSLTKSLQTKRYEEMSEEEKSGSGEIFTFYYLGINGKMLKIIHIPRSINDPRDEVSPIGGHYLEMSSSMKALISPITGTDLEFLGNYLLKVEEVFLRNLNS